ncbi:aminodeoxychorismate synthase, component I [Agaricicola taiwanensis]|uniref:aminodeoxychorismate synthase n=2 Tax=Agaricicola taiwanensis TaxID=591372 RepID=A0A8J3E021_9RHOB|nr:aminodeoxychorismate synthase, component I [Agaricicola taiwanensis]
MPQTLTIVRSIPWIDPVEAAGRLRGKGGLCFLDSAMFHDRLGRYSYVAADPYGVLKVSGGEVSWNGAAIDEAPLDAVSRRLGLFGQPIIEGLPPFQGGAIGYLSYEFGGLLEQLPAARTPRQGAMPQAELLFFDALCAFDHLEKRAWIVSTGLPEADGARRQARAVERAEEIERALRATPVPEGELPAIEREAWRSTFTRESYACAVGEAIEAILAGDIYQANISQRFTATLPEGFDAWAFYKRLRQINAAPFSAFIDRGDMAIASSSPERFLRVSGEEVETRPIKGTAPRASDPSEDEAHATALRRSEKDRAENLMIVDLLRNDLSRVCLPGTVMTPELCALETYAGVHHLVSVVTGRLQPGFGVADLMGAAFPGGSITGAPKIRAMEIISDIEQEQRGIYCGAIGYFGFNGESDTNIAIRTVLFQDGQASFQAGGGVTALSDPELEYQETLNKAERIFRAFEAPS